METPEKQPRVLSLVEANLAQIKWLNDMIAKELAMGIREDSLSIRQMKYQREKYLKELNEYSQDREHHLAILAEEAQRLNLGYV